MLIITSCLTVLFLVCVALVIFVPRSIPDTPAKHPDLFCNVEEIFGNLKYSTSACTLLAQRCENGPLADWEESYLLKTKNKRFFHQEHWWNDGKEPHVRVWPLTRKEAMSLYNHSAWQPLVSFEKAFDMPLVEA